ncbi:MAG: calcium/sodium antiporter [Bacteroidales bacterium]|nr:calcium/sodium antiporter [Bacteroidales bacterium]
MIIDILLLLIGLGLVVYGSDILVDGSSAIARKSGVSEFVIGLTIVGFGTSMPEMVVSLTGAIEGSADISIGNIVGSNTLNALLVLGSAAIITPIAVNRLNLTRDIPMFFGITLFFVLLASKGYLNWIDGLLMLTVFTAYIVMCFKSGKVDIEEAPKKDISLTLAIVMVIGGLAGLIFGGRLFVDHSVNFAREVGVSEKFIAITLLAGGTSMPELVTTIVAAAKKKGQLALGTIIGSNIFNILLVLGVASLLTRLGTGNIIWVDFAALLGSTVLLTLFAYIGKTARINRLEGALMALSYFAYIGWLIYTI